MIEFFLDVEEKAKSEQLAKDDRVQSERDEKFPNKVDDCQSIQLNFTASDTRIVLGRDDGLLNVRDKAVSRQQIALWRDTAHTTMLFAQVLGANSSSVNGRQLGAHDEAVSIGDRARISLLVDKYAFILRVVRKGGLPICELGSRCDRVNPLHWSQFSHDDDGNDNDDNTDEIVMANQVQDTVPLADDDDDDDDEEDSRPKKPPVVAMNGWRGALQQYARNPKDFGSVVRFFNDRVVVIEDKFPKARVHRLVLARDLKLNKVTDLHREHLPLLLEMQRIANDQIQQCSGGDRSFQVGFHAVPSMLVLHVHVISTDFDSSALKNKKHWNSFTTPFFISLVDVIERLRTTGAVSLRADESEAQLNSVMKCPHCGAVLKNIPTVKSHKC